MRRRCHPPFSRTHGPFVGLYFSAYGFLLPLRVVCAILFHCDGNPACRVCVNTYGFLYRGYRRAMWFWEGMIHLRKLLYVFIIIFGVGWPMMQAYLLLLVVAGALWLNIFFLPYTNQVSGRAEGQGRGGARMH